MGETILLRSSTDKLSLSPGAEAILTLMSVICELLTRPGAPCNTRQLQRVF